MSKIVTNDSFLQRVKEHFGDSISVLEKYVNSTSRIQVKCNVCGYEWSPMAGSLHRGHGCKMCAAHKKGKSKRISNADFLTQLNCIWGEKIIALEEYTRRHDPIFVQCNVCGHKWKALPHNLLHYEGCPYCCRTTHNTQDVIDFLKQNNYTCTLNDEYTGFYKKMKFICGCGNTFFTSYASIRKTHGICKECRSKLLKEKFSFSQSEAESILLKKTTGEYELVGCYNGYSAQSVFLHTACGNTFEARFDHLVGGRTSCKTCTERKSRGEAAIAKWLRSHQVPFEEQKRFVDCCGETKELSFDFYLTTLNLAIEYQGEQHYMPVEYFGGEDKFKRQTMYDTVKKNYCNNNGIKLVCIPYWEFQNLEHILDDIVYGVPKGVV